MRIALDTNVYSALKRGRAEAEDLVRRSHEVIVSAVVLGELSHGFVKGSRYEWNRRTLEEFLSNSLVRVVDVTSTTANYFGHIAADLDRRGKPIPTNDIWIAAHAMETGADLASYDPHFGEIQALSWVNLAVF
jgi:tRNA(fMet)-specific endonuclease VapC